MNTFKLIQIPLLLVLAVGCNNSDFSGNNKSKKKQPPPKPSDHVITVMGVDEVSDGGKKTISTIDNVRLIIQAGDSNQINNDTTTKQPVDLYFVIDSTASMTEEIQSVKTGVSQMVSQLKAENIDLQVGFVGFIDSEQSVEQRLFRLSDDIPGFQEAVNRLQPTSNQDYPEAGLFAARRAINLFRQPGAGRPEAIKAILMITDVIGHNGATTEGPQTRDCNVNPLVTDINNYATALGNQNQVKFFYVVPDKANAGSNDQGATIDCSGETGSFNIIDQMRSVVSSILPTIPEAQRGGPLVDNSGRIAWPLTSNNMTGTLVPMLKETVNQSNATGSCLAETAELKEAGRTLYTWKADSLATVGSQRNSNNQLQLDDVFKNADLTEGTHQLDLAVTRCCVALDQLSSNPQCTRRYTQTIRYEIIAKRPRS